MTKKAKDDENGEAQESETAAEPAEASDEPVSTRPKGDEGRAVREHQARLAEMDKNRGF